MPRVTSGPILLVVLAVAPSFARAQVPAPPTPNLPRGPGPEPARVQAPHPHPNGALKPPPMAVAERFGVALEAPRYNPDGHLGPTILLDGARDAHRLGFRTLKVAMSAQVVNPGWWFYLISKEEMARCHAIVDIARLDIFRRTFALPFRTFVITADAIGPVGKVWDSIATPGKRGQPRPADRPLSEEARSAIYWQLHDLARHLLDTYKGTGKVFILQSAEMDWRVMPYNDALMEPSDTAFHNAIEYSRLRQRAVDDARREAEAEGVYVYCCIEVNLVHKAMKGRRTVANVVLPRVESDLIGYSAYDTTNLSDGSFVRAVHYLRSVARPSAAFGRNQVFISEIGISERRVPDIVPTLRAVLEATTLGMPWVVQWALYDNQATKTVNGKIEPVYEATEADCDGLWVRKPDGSFGRVFKGYRPYLVYAPGGPEPTDAADYVARAYRLLLGREPDPPGAALAVRNFEEAPWDKERVVRDMMASPEYLDRTSGASAAFIFDVYRALLGRDPDDQPAVIALLESNYAYPSSRAGYLAAALRSPEAQRRYVDWAYRRLLGRPPTPAEAAPWLDLLARSGDRRQVYDGVAALGRPAAPPSIAR